MDEEGYAESASRDSWASWVNVQKKQGSEAVDWREGWYLDQGERKVNGRFWDRWDR